VVGRRFNLDGEHASALDFFPEQWVMVFEEELEKFLLMSPLNFVVVLHDVRLVSGVLGRRALGEERKREQDKKQELQNVLHGISIQVRR
jgi:hypothetical protein